MTYRQVSPAAYHWFSTVRSHTYTPSTDCVTELGRCNVWLNYWPSSHTIRLSTPSVHVVNPRLRALRFLHLRTYHLVCYLMRFLVYPISLYSFLTPFFSSDASHRPFLPSPILTHLMLGLETFFSTNFDDHYCYHFTLLQNLDLLKLFTSGHFQVTIVN